MSELRQLWPILVSPPLPPPSQIQGASQSAESGQTKAAVVLQEEELFIGRGGRKAAPKVIKCRPSLWRRHGQQRKWGDMLRWRAGRSLQATDKPCGGFQDGRGQLQVRWLYRGKSRTWMAFLSVFFFYLHKSMVFFHKLSKDHEAMTHILFGRDLRLKVAMTLWRRNASELVSYLIR